MTVTALRSAVPALLLTLLVAHLHRVDRPAGDDHAADPSQRGVAAQGSASFPDDVQRLLIGFEPCSDLLGQRARKEAHPERASQAHRQRDAAAVEHPREQVAAEVVGAGAVVLAVPLVFFSFSGSKLPGYILPAIPAAVVLVVVAATLLPASAGAAPGSTTLTGKLTVIGSDVASLGARLYESLSGTAASTACR